ncbi:hypothetical protein HMPREF3187_00861 [Aerococcus christensenii]|uniref:Uncharacterized protein n=1 Tax=Aerococcus christensenii TaxID=87541 RepID=A0A133XZL0_9LACT|nr:hypothetical protein HMPREF3187_00861 [Aerococcus christensenii]
MFDWMAHKAPLFLITENYFYFYYSILRAKNKQKVRLASFSTKNRLVV